jgi:hypothetical protein
MKFLDWRGEAIFSSIPSFSGSKSFVIFRRTHLPDEPDSVLLDFKKIRSESKNAGFLISQIKHMKLYFFINPFKNVCARLR